MFTPASQAIAPDGKKMCSLHPHIKVNSELVKGHHLGSSNSIAVSDCEKPSNRVWDTGYGNTEDTTIEESKTVTKTSMDPVP